MPKPSPTLASMRRRLVAAILDTMLSLPFVFWPNALLEALQLQLPSFALYWLNHLFYLLYFVLWVGFWSNTPGKWSTGMKIRHATTHQPLTWRQAILREGLGRFLCLLLLPVGYITAVLPKAKVQTLADEIGQSVVLRR